MIDILENEGKFYETIWGRLFLFFIPFVIAASYIVLLYLILHDLGNTFWIVGGGMATYFFPPFGKESVIPITIGSLLGLQAIGLSPMVTIFLVSSTIAFIDIVTAYFLLWNFYIAKKIPYIGKWIEEFQEYGAQKMKEREWVKRLAFLGVTSFVMFPFQGSGGVGASILGRVIGMNKYYAWISIIAGAFVGCFFIGIVSYYTGGAIIRAFKSSIFTGVATLILVIAGFIILYRFSKARLLPETE